MARTLLFITLWRLCAWAVCIVFAAPECSFAAATAHVPVIRCIFGLHLFRSRRHGKVFMSVSTIDRFRQPDAGSEPAAGTITWILSLCCCVLMFVCFSVPDRDSILSMGSLDAVGLVKLATRIGCILLLLCLFARNWRVDRSPLVVKQLAPFCLFLAWGLLSVLWSPLPQISLGQLSVPVVLILLAANVGAQWRSPADTSRLLAALCIALAVIAWLLLLLHFTVPEYGSLSRVADGLVHPTAAAAIGGVGLVLVLAVRLLWAWEWSRWLLWPAAIGHICLLYVANSRTSIGLSFVLITGIALLFANRQLLLSLVVLGSAAVALYLVVDPGERQAEHHVVEAIGHLHRGQQGRLLEFSGRAEMWQIVWTSFQTSPWVGHGYFVTSANGDLFVWEEWGNHTAHNAILQTLASTGVVGLILFAVGIGYPFLSFLRRATTPHARRLAQLLVVLSIWYLGWGLFNESITGPLAPESVVFYVVLGLVVGVTAWSIASERETEDGNVA